MKQCNVPLISNTHKQMEANSEPDSEEWIASTTDARVHSFMYDTRVASLKSCLPSLAVRVCGIKFAQHILIRVQLPGAARHLGAWAGMHEEGNAIAIEALWTVVLNPVDGAFQSLVCPQREQVLQHIKAGVLVLNEGLSMQQHMSTQQHNNTEAGRLCQHGWYDAYP